MNGWKPSIPFVISPYDRLRILVLKISRGPCQNGPPEAAACQSGSKHLVVRDKGLDEKIKLRTTVLEEF